MTIVGRKDDMIISGGENVQPVQVEAVINENPKVADNVVMGVPDEKWGQVVVAQVVKRDPLLTAGNPDGFFKNHLMLSCYRRPQDYRFVEALFMTATGKEIHYKAKEKAMDDMKMGCLKKLNSVCP